MSLWYRTWKELFCCFHSFYSTILHHRILSLYLYFISFSTPFSIRRKLKQGPFFEFVESIDWRTPSLCDNWVPGLGLEIFYHHRKFTTFLSRSKLDVQDSSWKICMAYFHKVKTSVYNELFIASFQTQGSLPKLLMICSIHLYPILMNFYYTVVAARAAFNIQKDCSLACFSNNRKVNQQTKTVPKNYILVPMKS